MRRSSYRREEAEGDVVALEDARRRRRVDEIVREHGAFLRMMAKRLCRSQFDADDLLQDVIERTLHHFDRLPQDVNHRAWMTHVMRNAFIDLVRRSAAAPATTPVDALPLAVPKPEEEPWWHRLDADDVRVLLGELPDELRVAFELFALEGLSYQAIAQLLGVPRPTVGTRILRARRRLKELLLAARREGSDE